MNETRTFEIQNYRQGTTVGFVTLENGEFSADTEAAQKILSGVQRSQKDEAAVIEYLSTHTTQSLSYREVGAE